ncbi:hypothetical protein ACQ86N_32530 [Puia sp. P3]
MEEGFLVGSWRRRMAQRAGVSVRALMPEMTMEMASVRENWR